MCLIIYKPATAKLDLDACYNGMVENHDGVGYMVRVNGEIIYNKGLWNFKILKERIKKYEDFDLGIHFRLKSHGAINTDNCHPFAGTGWCLMHNGIISSFGSHEKSDTAEFTEFINELFEEGAPFRQDVYESFIGGSKLLFAVEGNEDWVIVNEKYGHWEKGCWYSNKSYTDGFKKWNKGYSQGCGYVGGTVVHQGGPGVNVHHAGDTGFE